MFEEHYRTRGLASELCLISLHTHAEMLTTVNFGWILYSSERKKLISTQLNIKSKYFLKSDLKNKKDFCSCVFPYQIALLVQIPP